MKPKTLSLAVTFLAAALCQAGGPAQAEVGIASYYTIRTNGGTRTASGKPLRDNVPSAAHKTLPFGTVVKVTRLRTGKSILVTITDRGPYRKGRIIDLNLAAARALGITPKDGIAKVTVQRIPTPKKPK